MSAFLAAPLYFTYCKQTSHKSSLHFGFIRKKLEAEILETRLQASSTNSPLSKRVETWSGSGCGHKVENQCEPFNNRLAVNPIVRKSGLQNSNFRQDRMPKAIICNTLTTRNPTPLLLFAVSNSTYESWNRKWQYFYKNLIWNKKYQNSPYHFATSPFPSSTHVYKVLKSCCIYRVSVYTSFRDVLPI